MLSLLFGFHGRVRRLHWWLIRLGYIGFAIAVLGLVALVQSVFPVEAEDGPIASAGGLSMILCYALFVWSNLATNVKRFHDRDKTGWWVMIALIPLIGPIWLLVECGFLDGTQGPNDHGPSPKGLGVDEDLVRAFT
jgi:uncharacterized membrane protein YhaH (DUF805 family)